jgi:glycosyltransferase involved in cell wall biosynthesis
MKCSILLTVPNFITAGSQLVILDILRHLDPTIFAPTVAVLQRGGQDHQVSAAGVPLICRPFTIPAWPRRTLLQRARRTAQLFSDLQVDVWHSWHYTDDYTEPLIARFAGTCSWIYTKKNMSWGSNGWRLRSLLARRIVVNNPLMVSQFFSAPIYRYKTEVISQGVDTCRFQPMSGDHKSWRTRLAIPARAPLVGCVGSLVPVKEHTTLLRALALTRTQPHLLLVGKGEEVYQKQLQTVIAELDIGGRVYFAGHVDHKELPQLISELDIFALTSRAEGLPVALLEAMACEVACVATRCGGPEAVIEDGEDGFLVPVGDAQQVAVRLDTLVNDRVLRQQMGRAARKKVMAYFDAAGQGRLYADLYCRLANRA